MKRIGLSLLIVLALLCGTAFAYKVGDIIVTTRSTIGAVTAEKFSLAAKMKGTQGYLPMMEQMLSTGELQRFDEGEKFIVKKPPTFSKGLEASPVNDLSQTFHFGAGTNFKATQ